MICTAADLRQIPAFLLPSPLGHATQVTHKRCHEYRDRWADVSPAARLPRGLLARGIVVCHHPWGMGVLLDYWEQVGHVEPANLRNTRNTPEADVVPLGTRLSVTVLGYTEPVGLRRSSRLADLPGMAHPSNLPQ